MCLAVLVASLFAVKKHSAHTADARRIPVSDASQVTLVKRGRKASFARVVKIHLKKRGTA